MSIQDLPPASWYPEGGRLRYWDGRTWTQHVAPLAAALPAVQPPPAQALVMRPDGLAPAVGVAPKSPGIGLLASFFVPGLGSMVNGEVAKGVVILLSYAVSWLLVFVLVGIPLVLGLWIYGMVDGYQGAQRWNARYGILS